MERMLPDGYPTDVAFAYLALAARFNFASESDGQKMPNLHH